MKKSFLLIFLFLLLLHICLPAQTKKDLQKDTINYLHLSLISGATACGLLYGHILQNDIWWTGNRTNFHFEWNNDWNKSLGADKLGHIYFPYLVTNLYSQAFQWSGINKDKSFLYAGIFSFSYQTYVEIVDGFTDGLGFSWGDFTANLLGSSYPILQNKYHFLKNFNFKISYYPSQRFKNNSNKYIIDDYESTYHWLTIDVYNLLPESFRKYYPKFINLSIGHGVKGLDDLKNSFHEFFFGLDWNLEGLPGSGWFWELIKKNFNYYKLPAPAVRLSKGDFWIGLKY